MIPKPSNLRILCDGLNIDHRAGEVWRPRLREQLHAGNMLSTKDNVPQPINPISCTCRPRRRLERRYKRWGWVEIYKDIIHFEAHLPTCAFSQITNTFEQNVGMRYTGLTWLLNKAVHITLSMKSGAGGMNISPRFTYFATVNQHKAPAFRVISWIDLFLKEIRLEGIKVSENQLRYLINAGLVKIGKLFREGKALSVT
jgi:hypothetical protein